jgi:hypothetical protein
LTLYKKPFRYRLPVSPPSKRTKTSSSTPNLKSPSIRTSSLLKKISFNLKILISFQTGFHTYFWHVHTLRSVFVNSPPPKPEVILANFFAEPTVLLVPITSRAYAILLFSLWLHFLVYTGCFSNLIFIDFNKWRCAYLNIFLTSYGHYSIFSYCNCNSYIEKLSNISTMKIEMS